MVTHTGLVRLSSAITPRDVYTVHPYHCNNIMGVRIIRTCYRFIPGYWLDVGTNARSPIFGRRIAECDDPSAVTEHTQSRAGRRCRNTNDRASNNIIIIYDNIIILLRYNGTRVLLYRLRMRRRQMTLDVCFYFLFYSPLLMDPTGTITTHTIYTRSGIIVFSVIFFIFIFVIYISSILNREFLALSAFQKKKNNNNIYLHIGIHLYITCIRMLSSCH